MNSFRDAHRDLKFSPTRDHFLVVAASLSPGAHLGWYGYRNFLHQLSSEWFDESPEQYLTSLKTWTRDWMLEIGPPQFLQVLWDLTHNPPQTEESLKYIPTGMTGIEDLLPLLWENMNEIHFPDTREFFIDKIIIHEGPPPSWESLTILEMLIPIDWFEGVARLAGIAFYPEEGLLTSLSHSDLEKLIDLNPDTDPANSKCMHAIRKVAAWHLEAFRNKQEELKKEHAPNAEKEKRTLKDRLFSLFRNRGASG